ncbi:hypothetical protein AGLY_011377 [Aphis glycines]|uniref:Uncharacterized protein n=1 Tax=Aphis glycines TaxID=307491 RepID=A0A6G0TE65_APHGL|nr:hypothetical protein AGLY_011377 [Aphis glycines]
MLFGVRSSSNTKSLSVCCQQNISICCIYICRTKITHSGITPSQVFIQENTDIFENIACLVITILIFNKKRSGKSFCRLPLSSVPPLSTINLNIYIDHVDYISCHLELAEFVILKASYIEKPIIINHFVQHTEQLMHGVYQCYNASCAHSAIVAVTDKLKLTYKRLKCGAIYKNCLFCKYIGLGFDELCIVFQNSFCCISQIIFQIEKPDESLQTVFDYSTLSCPKITKSNFNQKNGSKIFIKIRNNQ